MSNREPYKWDNGKGVVYTSVDGEEVRRVSNRGRTVKVFSINDPPDGLADDVWMFAQEVEKQRRLVTISPFDEDNFKSFFDREGWGEGDEPLYISARRFEGVADRNQVDIYFKDEGDDLADWVSLPVEFGNQSGALRFLQLLPEDVTRDTAIAQFGFHDRGKV